MFDFHGKWPALRGNDQINNGKARRWRAMDQFSMADGR
jgi:hypothetical protein